MTDATDKPRRGRAPKRIAPIEMATIIAYADLHSDADAAKRFKLAARTIGRHRADIRKGLSPELADLVAGAKAKLAERHADLLDSGFEAAVQRIKRLLPKASIKEAIDAAQTLGELKIQRDLFGGDDESTPAARARAAARAPAGRGSGAPSASTDTPVH